jgi:HK97 family phage prohead protease
MSDTGLRTFYVPLDEFEWRESGDPERKNETTLRGIAAPFNSLSEDLGGFREIIEPGFFRDVLRRDPDVRLMVNHDGLPLARTRSGTLELREDMTRGLHVFARLDKTDDDVRNLRVKMQRHDVDQMSFAFRIKEEGGDDWAVADDGKVVRTLKADGASELYDVSVVAFPAYPASSADMRSVLDDAIKRGRLPGEAIPPVASDEGQGDTPPSPTGDGESEFAPPAELVRSGIWSLKRRAKDSVRSAQFLQSEIEKDLR